ncbi:MAG: CBS domain-containing protein [Desulfobulbaceae bacterium]|jgi:acetoin utilization protein AcuB|nr:CBS domain-containing protein [Desulfobulbaceae bacterium]
MFVKLWMNREPITVTPHQSAAEALDLMRERGIRHLPVVDGEKRLLGIVSSTDIAAIQPSKMANAYDHEVSSPLLLPVEAFMSRSPLTAEPMTPIEQVARRMRRHKLGGMPVVADGKLVGVFTESDLCAACMSMLGEGRGGVRVELIFGKGEREYSQALTNIFSLFRRHGAQVLAFALHRDYSDEQALATTRLKGEELADLLAALSDAGVTIYRALEEEE